MPAPKPIWMAPEDDTERLVGTDKCIPDSTEWFFVFYRKGIWTNVWGLRIHPKWYFATNGELVTFLEEFHART